VAAALLVGVTAGAQAPRRSGQAASLRDERAFAAQLQRAIRTGDRMTVAGLLRYPARVSVQRRPYPVYVKDRDSLIEMFDLVFTPHLRCAIVESREPVAGEPQPKHPLLLASGVVSIAGGRIVAERSGRKYEITRISSFGDTSTRNRPRAVTFTAGQRKAEVAGRAAETGADAYIVTARPGDRLEVSLKWFPAGSLALRVSRGSGGVLDGGNQSGSAWTARLDEGGDYLVEVVRRSPYCEPPVISHVLTVLLTAQ
jgi:hypothetical protein